MTAEGQGSSVREALDSIRRRFVGPVLPCVRGIAPLLVLSVAVVGVFCVFRPAKETRFRRAARESPLWQLAVPEPGGPNWLRGLDVSESDAPMVISFLGDPNPRIRGWAAFAAARLPPLGGLRGGLERHSGDQDPEVGLLKASALCLYGDYRAINNYLRNEGHPPDLRVQCLGFLAHSQLADGGLVSGVSPLLLASNRGLAEGAAAVCVRSRSARGLAACLAAVASDTASQASLRLAETVARGYPELGFASDLSSGEAGRRGAWRRLGECARLSPVITETRVWVLRPSEPIGLPPTRVSAAWRTVQGLAATAPLLGIRPDTTDGYRTRVVLWDPARQRETWVYETLGGLDCQSAISYASSLQRVFVMEDRAVLSTDLLGRSVHPVLDLGLSTQMRNGAQRVVAEGEGIYVHAYQRSGMIAGANVLVHARGNGAAIATVIAGRSWVYKSGRLLEQVRGFGPMDFDTEASGKLWIAGDDNSVRTLQGPYGDPEAVGNLPSPGRVLRAWPRRPGTALCATVDGSVLLLRHHQRSIEATPVGRAAAMVAPRPGGAEFALIGLDGKVWLGSTADRRAALVLEVPGAGPPAPSFPYRPEACWSEDGRVLAITIYLCEEHTTGHEGQIEAPQVGVYTFLLDFQERTVWRAPWGYQCLTWVQALGVGAPTDAPPTSPTTHSAGRTTSTKKR